MYEAKQIERAFAAAIGATRLYGVRAMAEAIKLIEAPDFAGITTGPEKAAIDAYVALLRNEIQQTIKGTAE